MKKFFMLFVLCCFVMTASAQFEKGTKYIGASLSNLGMSYSKKTEFRFGLQADAGYYFADRWMLHADAGYAHQKSLDEVFIGADVRYNITQNGLYLSAGAQYSHLDKNVNDLLIPVELGYTFFLNNKIAIEPAVYYKMSTNDFGDGSTVGLRIGLGYYF